MIIRPAVNEDVDTIMQLIAVVVPLMRASGNLQWSADYPNPEIFLSDIAKQQLWVAEVDNNIAGVAAITTDQYPEYKQAGLDISQTAIVVHRLAVNVNNRRQGIAEALMNEAERIANDRNIKFLRIDTNSKNTGTQALFLKAGYQFAGEIMLEFRADMSFFCYQKILQ